MTTTSGPAWWASAFGTIIDGAGAVWVPAGCYDLCTLFKADSDFGIAGWWCRILLGDSCQINLIAWQLSYAKIIEIF